MPEIQDSFQEVAAPFEPGPPRPSGCLRAGLIGCGVLVLLLGIALVVLLSKREAITRWSFERAQEQILAAEPPPDLTQEERQRLELAFEAATEATLAGEVEMDQVQALQRQLQRVLSTPPERRTREDLLHLVEALEAVGDSGEGEGRGAGEDPGAGPAGGGETGEAR